MVDQLIYRLVSFLAGCLSLFIHILVSRYFYSCEWGKQRWNRTNIEHGHRKKLTYIISFNTSHITGRSIDIYPSLAELKTNYYFFLRARWQMVYSAHTSNNQGSAAPVTSLCTVCWLRKKCRHQSTTQMYQVNFYTWRQTHLPQRRNGTITSVVIAACCVSVCERYLQLTCLGSQYVGFTLYLLWLARGQCVFIWLSLSLV